MVRIVPGVAGSHHIILIARLVVLVPYIDALLIDHVGAGIFRNFSLLVPAVCRRHEVYHRRRGIVVAAVGIHKASRRIYIACKDLAHRVNARDAYVPDPEARVHIVIILFQEIDLKRVR